MASTPKPAKTMSSRLLTMRFMQRSIASSPTSSSPKNNNSKTRLAASPTSASPKNSHNDHPKQPPSKRKRLSNGSPAAVPSTGVSGGDQSYSYNHSQNYDDAMRAALAAEEALRVQADERRAKVRGESRWALSFMNPQYPTGEGDGDGGHGSKSQVLPLQVVTAGYGDIDAFTASTGGLGSEKEYTSTIRRSNESQSTQDGNSSVGRRTFGKFKRRVSEVTGNSAYPNKHANIDVAEKEDDDENEEEEDDDDDDTDSENSSDSKESGSSSSVSSHTTRRKHSRIHESPRRHVKTTTPSLKSSKDTKGQKKVSTRRLTSISAAGAATDDSRIVCHRCMMKGHKLKDCPKMVRVGDKREQKESGSGVRGGKGHRRAPMGL